MPTVYELEFLLGSGGGSKTQPIDLNEAIAGDLSIPQDDRDAGLAGISTIIGQPLVGSAVYYRFSLPTQPSDDERLVLEAFDSASAVQFELLSENVSDRERVIAAESTRGGVASLSLGDVEPGRTYWLKVSSDTSRST